MGGIFRPGAGAAVGPQKVIERDSVSASVYHSVDFVDDVAILTYNSRKNKMTIVRIGIDWFYEQD